MDPYTPFCGTPPIPADLLGRWLFDPALLAGLAVFAAALWVTAKDRRSASIGWAITALLFVSPICAASIALFSARVLQHVLLVLVAAPLIAYALPRVRLPLVSLSAVLTALFWFWHMPMPYAATLQADLAYWAMHLSLFGTAIAFWSAILAHNRTSPGTAVLGLGIVAGQMTLLSAVFVFSSNTWHSWHSLTALPYGISGLQDQQLAGSIMWVGGGALLLVGIAMMAFRFMQQHDTRVSTG